MECFGGRKALGKFWLCPGVKEGLQGVLIAPGRGIAEWSISCYVEDVDIVRAKPEEFSNVDMMNAEDDLVQVGQLGRFYHEIQRDQTGELVSGRLRRIWVGKYVLKRIDPYLTVNSYPLENADQDIKQGPLERTLVLNLARLCSTWEVGVSTNRTYTVGDRCP